MRISDWSSDVCSSDLARSITACSPAEPPQAFVNQLRCRTIHPARLASVAFTPTGRRDGMTLDALAWKDGRAVGRDEDHYRARAFGPAAPPIVMLLVNLPAMGQMARRHAGHALRRTEERL